MTAAQLTKTLLVFALYVFAIAVTPGAAELRTYQVVPDQQRLFRIDGGWGVNASGQLAGSFDVEVNGNGTATLSRFDVQLVDIQNHGPTNVAWPSTQELASLLFVNPIGLTGIHDSTSIYISSHPFPPPLATELQTTLTLALEAGPWARLGIVSNWLQQVDGAAYRTESPGFLVQAVPEPESWAIAILGRMVARTQSRDRGKNF